MLCYDSNSGMKMDKDFYFKHDIWSAGVILYELFYKEKPFKGSNPNEIYKNINKELKFNDKITFIH